MKLWVERKYPLVVGILAAGAYRWCAGSQPLPASAKDLFNAVITVAAIGVGFLVTAQSILIDVGDRFLSRQIKEVRLWKPLLGYFRHATWWGFASAGSGALLLFFLNPTEPRAWHSLVFCCWIVIVVTAAASAYRVISIFFSLIRDADS